MMVSRQPKDKEKDNKLSEVRYGGAQIRKGQLPSIP
jgi:hypothetical protein